MSISHCLGPAVERIAQLPRTQWEGEIAKLPEHCPHRGDCTVRGGCREHVADYFRMQWRMQQHRARIGQRKAGARHGQG